MPKHAVMGLFCDDLRMERNGQETIVGVFPDTVNVPYVPGVLSKFCVYVRFHLDTNNRPGTIKLKINSPDEIEHPEIEVEKEVIEKAYSDAEKNGQPFAGVISRTIISPFPFNQTGRIEVIVSIDNEEQICASMSVKIAEQKAET
jgi:hypothetical protein